MPGKDGRGDSVIDKRPCCILSLDKVGREKKISLAVVFGVFLLWLAVAELGNIPKLFLPSPLDVLALAKEMASRGVLQNHIRVSLYRILAGYGIGAAAAIIVGLLMGRYRIIEAIIDPIYQMWRPVPPIAAIPLIILWVGIGEDSKLIVIAGGTFAVCLINVVTGIKNVPRLYLESARVLGSSEFQIFRNIIIPSAVPYILSGMRTAMGVALGVMVAAELIASFEGIGFILIMGKNLLRTDMIFLGIILIGMISYFSDLLLRKLDSYLTRWMERG